jgi:HK97 family phage major capsid protein
VATSGIVHYTKEAVTRTTRRKRRKAHQARSGALTFEAVDAPVRTIAHFIRASRQVLDDAAALQSYIDTRMRHGVRQRLEAQIIAGNGTGPTSRA